MEIVPLHFDRQFLITRICGNFIIEKIGELVTLQHGEAFMLW